MNLFAILVNRKLLSSIYMNIYYLRKGYDLIIFQFQFCGKFVRGNFKSVSVVTPIGSHAKSPWQPKHIFLNPTYIYLVQGSVKSNY